MEELKLSETSAERSREHKSLIKDEFEKTAEAFAERTKGRFDELDVVAFARARPGWKIVEVGGGTGNFLQLFEPIASVALVVDLTPGMLLQAKRRFPWMGLVAGEAEKIPLASGSIDLVCSAQMFHHVFEPIPIIREMGRVAGLHGSVLIVDQTAGEDPEEQRWLTELEIVRDPSHAVSRSASQYRELVTESGLEIVDEKLHEVQNRFSQWMWRAEFAEERIEKVQKFLEEHGSKVGLDFSRVGDDWTFNRKRILILARVA